MKKNRGSVKSRINSKVTGGVLWVAMLINSLPAIAQDGNAGINKANEAVRSYFDSGTDLMYGVGALLGLIGAVKVYQK